MSQSITVDNAIQFAKNVLDLAPGQGINVSHSYNYFSRASKKQSRNQSKDSNSLVIYSAPGKAKQIEIKNSRNPNLAGRFPQHNSQGIFSPDLQILPSLVLDDFKDLHSIFSLEESGFVQHRVFLTKKKIADLALQFAHLSSDCFKEMLCLQAETTKRDFDIWLKQITEREYVIAYINPNNFLIQFIQSIVFDEEGQIVDLRHIVYETSIPLVINQTCFDTTGRLRNIAHVGITGSSANSFVNSLERFDDGTLIWTSSDFKNNNLITGSAALLDNGAVILLPGSDRLLAEFSARNLGAEGIDSQSQSWTGSYSPDAAVPEEQDKYIVRREYKSSVRKQVNQIIDGACIPGLNPIFNLPNRSSVYHNQ